MAEEFSLHDRVVRITHIYLGPAADRFIERQVQNHLSKPADQLTAKDLSTLIDWIRVAVSLLTDDKEIIEEYVAQLTLLTKTPKSNKRKAATSD